MAEPTYYYDQGLLGVPEERSLADTISSLQKCADGGRTEVVLSTFSGPLPNGEELDREPTTEVAYYDSAGNLCGKIITPGDPFGLGVPGLAESLLPSAGITEFWTVTPEGSVTALIKGMASVDPDTFMANFVTAPTSLNAYTDFLDLTNGGCNGVGQNNNDKFDFGTGANIVTGGAGDDRLYKTASGDITFKGGTGTDWLIFQASDGDAFVNTVTQKMIVNLATGTGQNPYGGLLTLKNVEKVIGTYAADLIIGDNKANRIGDGFGDVGADTIRAGGGDDTVVAADIGTILADGGRGFDRLVFIQGFDLQDAGTAAHIRNFELFSQSQVSSGLPSVSLAGDANANWFVGGDGSDTLIGRGGDDTLDGGHNTFAITPAINVAVFSSGRAHYTITRQGATITVHDDRPGAPDGTDTVVNVEVLRFADKDLSVATRFPTIGTAVFTDTYTGNARDISDKDDSYYGTDANDSLAAKGGHNLLVGGLGDDGYYVTDTKDTIVELAGGGTDTVYITDQAVAGSYSISNQANVENLSNQSGIRLSLTGSAMDNLITSGTAGDTLYGGAGNDTLIGGHGSVVSGGNGDDRFNSYISGFSNDTMTGGNGADTFVFADIITSAPTPAQPLITDFRGDLGDRVDLSAIDALAGAPDDAFLWRGAPAFTGAGQVRVAHEGAVSYLEINLTGTDTPEARIEFTGNLALQESYFIL